MANKLFWQGQEHCKQKSSADFLKKILMIISFHSISSVGLLSCSGMRRLLRDYNLGPGGRECLSVLIIGFFIEGAHLPLQCIFCDHLIAQIAHPAATVDLFHATSLGHVVRKVSLQCHFIQVV